ncbi:PspA-associated protein PspAB [Spirillospora sp. CA-255316]
MGFLDALLGRSKPVKPDLDRLFALPTAAVTLEAAAGFTPTGLGSVCFRAVEGGAFARLQRDVQELLDADEGPRVELSNDSYGYTWLLARHSPDELPALVTDLHAVNASLESAGFGPHLLCSLAGFRGPAPEGRRLALVYLYKRGTFYPFAPLPGGVERRDNALELQVRGAVGADLPFEDDLGRWFPVWGAPGL